MKVKNSRGGTKNGVRIVVSWNRFDAFVFSNSLNKITYLRFGVNGRTGGRTTGWMVLNDMVLNDLYTYKFIMLTFQQYASCYMCRLLML